MSSDVDTNGSGSTPSIDLNADLGEGYGRWTLGDDDALLDIVTSANVACGYHAGDASSMRSVCAAAAERRVAIGAQVGYLDLAGFGRSFLDVDPAVLTDQVIHQIGALDAFARLAGTRVRYVKPHGALYHAVTHHRGQAEAVVRAVIAASTAVAPGGAGLPVLCLPDSLVLHLAEEAGLPTRTESFADRAYTASGGLVPRTRPGAVLQDREATIRQALALATGQPFPDVDGHDLTVLARSLCLHGDTPGAVESASAVRSALERAGVTIEHGWA